MFQCSVINNDGVLFEDAITSITFPSSDGMQTLLNNHMDIIVALGSGKGYFKIDNNKISFALEGGLLVFKDNVCKVYPVTFWTESMNRKIENYSESFQKLIGSIV